MSFIITKHSLSENKFLNNFVKLELAEYNLYYNPNKFCREISIATETMRLICVGTPMYKSFAYEEVLEKIAHDYLSNQFNIDEVKGNYCLIFIHNNTLNFFVDRTGQHAVYFDKTNNHISNSLQLLINLNQNIYTLNKLGFYERLAIGYNIGEETIINEIIKITHHNKSLVENSTIIFNTFQPIDLTKINFHKHGKKRSQRDQINHLSEYFKLINQTFKNHKGDLGLSGGFDCRFVLALAEKNLDQKLHLHTHFTKGVHEKDSHYADKLGEAYGMPIAKIETISPSELDEISMKEMLDENVAFFDLRSARHLGAYSQTYTSAYKKASMGDAFYSLNGLGGEIYRDSYFTGNKKMTWDEWANRYLFLELTQEVLPQDIVSELSSHLKKKILQELKWDKSYFDIVFTHGYYGLIKMPQCNGNLVAAYNKISPFILPFVEYDNVIEAIKAIPYLGVGGQYQASLINLVSPQLAALPNHYGNSFQNLGVKYYLWSYLKTLGSAEKRRNLVTKNLVKKYNSEGFRVILKKLYKNKTIKDDFDYVKNILPDLKVELAMVDSTQRRSMIFISHLLNQYAHKIKP